jgi:hypothetical protein
MQEKPSFTIKDCYADESEPPPGYGKGPKENFVIVYGVDQLNAYLVERQATIVYPLLLTVRRYLRMAERRGETEVALTAAVWEGVGASSKMKRTRETMLAHIRQMPELVTLRDSRTLMFRYYVGMGPAWRQMETEAGRKDRKA